MICPGCFKENVTAGKFCSFCGTSLADRSRIRTTVYPNRTAQNPRTPVEDRWRGGYQESDWDLGGAVDSAARAVGSAVKGGYAMFNKGEGTGDSTEGLSHGQIVIIAARWVLVVAGLLLALWDPAGMGELQVSIVLILALAVGNFFLHSHVIRGQQVPATVAYAASAADIGVISLVLVVTGGFNTIPYVFYFPALLALSVAFPPKVTALFTGAIMAIYGLVSVASASPSEGPALVTQLVMLAGVAFCGNAYWRIERDRRATIGSAPTAKGR